MAREIKIESENDVKLKIIKPWFDRTGGWHYAPIQNGMGVAGIHDRIGCVPIVVTQAMVGKTIGLFVSVEAKAPGRRREPDRGMTPAQRDNMVDINEAHGLSIVCDSFDDMQELTSQLCDLTGVLTLKERVNE